MSSVCVIADPHVNPGSKTTHFGELGTTAATMQFDYMVGVGDMADFASQRYHKKRRGTHTLQQELDAVESALSELYAPMDEANYSPTMVWTMGNHDGPELAELLEPKWEVVEENVPYVLDGVHYCHKYPKGISDMVATSPEDILANTLCNTVSGHSHIRGYAETYDLNSNRIFAVKCPTFRQDKPKWPGLSVTKWAHGYTMMNDGQFVAWRDIEHE